MLRWFPFTGRYGRLIAILCLLGLMVYVGILMANADTRKPWNDEAMSADAGYNLGFKGNTGVAFYDEQAYGLIGASRHTYYIFPLQLCVLAGWYHIAGFSLFTTRLLAMLWFFGMLIALYRLIQKVTQDSAIAFLSVLLVAVDYQMMTAASFGRYETMVAALGYGGYACYLTLRERNLPLALLLGNTLIVCAGTTHPNGVFYFAGLWFLILYHDRSRLRFRDECLAAVPYVVGAGLWSLYILRDFESFRIQMTRNSGGRFGLLHPLESIRSEIITRYMAAFGLGLHSAGHNLSLVKLKALALVAYAAGIIGCLAIPAIRRNRAYRPLLVLALIHWLLLTFYENIKFSYYLIHLIPFYCVLLAFVTVTLWRNRRSWRWAIAGALTMLALVQVGGILAKIRLDEYRKVYLPTAQFVQQHAAPSDEVFAVCSFGFAYGFDRNAIDDESLGYFSGKRAKFIVLEEIFDGQHQMMRTLSPDKYRHVKQMLDSYKLVYQNGEYRVYARPDIAASLNAAG